MMKYEFIDDVEEDIRNMALKCGVSPDAVLGEAIGLLYAALEEIEAGNKIAFVDPDGKGWGEIALNISPVKKATKRVATKKKTKR